MQLLYELLTTQYQKDMNVRNNQAQYMMNNNGKYQSHHRTRAHGNSYDIDHMLNWIDS